MMQLLRDLLDAVLTRTIRGTIAACTCSQLQRCGEKGTSFMTTNTTIQSKRGTSHSLQAASELPRNWIIRLTPMIVMPSMAATSHPINTTLSGIAPRSRKAEFQLYKVATKTGRTWTSMPAWKFSKNNVNPKIQLTSITELLNSKENQPSRIQSTGISTDESGPRKFLLTRKSLATKGFRKSQEIIKKVFWPLKLNNHQCQTRTSWFPKTNGRLKKCPKKGPSTWVQTKALLTKNIWQSSSGNSKNSTVRSSSLRMTILKKRSLRLDKRSGTSPRAVLKFQLNLKKGIVHLGIRSESPGRVRTLLQTRCLRLETTLGRVNLSTWAAGAHSLGLLNRTLPGLWTDKFRFMMRNIKTNLRWQTRPNKTQDQRIKLYHMLVILHIKPNRMLDLRLTLNHILGLFHIKPDNMQDQRIMLNPMLAFFHSKIKMQDQRMPNRMLGFTLTRPNKMQNPRRKLNRMLNILHLKTKKK